MSFKRQHERERHHATEFGKRSSYWGKVNGKSVEGRGEAGLWENSRRVGRGGGDQRDRQRSREREKETEIQRDKDTQRETERCRETEIDKRETDRNRVRHREIKESHRDK
ncbi:hypothetical protein ACQP3J_28135, partial [Escherichia coli]